MTIEFQRSAPTGNRMITRLRELVSALDRRAPHLGRPGELRIAQDAQMLRSRAVAQIEALRRGEWYDLPYDQQLVHAIMTDDGCPSSEV
jgi:hypothetical protein